MRPITKIVLAIIALLVLLQAAIVVGIAWPIPAIDDFTAVHWSWLRIVLLTLTAITAAAALLLLLGVLFRRSSTRDLHIKTARGELVMSKKAVEKSVATAVAKTHDIKNVGVQLQLRRQQVTKATIRVTQWQVQDAKSLGDAIEATVRHQLAQTLGVPVRRVRVRVKQADRADAANVI